MRVVMSELTALADRGDKGADLIHFDTTEDDFESGHLLLLLVQGISIRQDLSRCIAGD